MKLVIDISYYNDLPPDKWDILAPVLDGVIIRMGFGITIDNLANAHLEQCRRLGLPIAGYFWSDPTRRIQDQVSMIQRAISFFKPVGIFLDAEQYWTDWSAYMRMDLVAAQATKFSPENLNNFYKTNYETTRETLKPIGVKVANYSSPWFVDGYAPGMREWIYGSRNYWDARYFRYNNVEYWERKKEELGLPFDISNMRSIARYAFTTRRSGSSGRQFESYIEIKGLSKWQGYHLDWNVFTDRSFSEMFTQPGNPEPTPPVIKNFYRVVNTGSDNLNVRATPPINGIPGTWVGSLPPGSIIEIAEIRDSWGKILTQPAIPEKWVSMQYLQKIYAIA